MRGPAVVALSAALLTGCASVDPKPAFVDVGKTVSDRTGHDLEWTRTPADAEQVERATHALLQDELTLESATRLALLNNRAFQATLEELGISQADLAQSALLKNTEADGFARFPKGAPSRTNYEFGLVQDVLDILTRPLRKKIGAAQLEQTKLRVGGEALGLIADVKAAYITLQAREQLVTRLRLVMQIDEAAAQFAARQHEAGTLSELDLASHQATWNQSKVDVAVEETQARSDREHLNRLMGLWGADTAWKIAPRLPEIPEQEIALEGLESLALRQRLDLAAARWGVDLVGRALALKKGTRYFPVGINVGVQRERDSDGQRVTGPSLALQLPFLDTGKASIARLEAQHRQAQRQLEALAVDARSEVREARDLLLASRGLATYYRQVLLPQRIHIVDLTLKQHNMMLKGAYDLLLAKQNEVAAERAYVDALRDYWLARVRLERALGGSLGATEATPKAQDEGGQG